MGLLLAALLAVVPLAGCARAGPPPRPASTATADVLAASTPFYPQAWQGTGPLAVSVIDGFTGQKDATIAAPKDAGSFPWMGGHKTWYPCGAAPDDRTFLLCDTDQYYELRLGDDGKPQPMSAPADIPAAARNTGSNGDPEFAVSPDRRLAAVTTATGGSWSCPWSPA